MRDTDVVVAHAVTDNLFALNVTAHNAACYVYKRVVIECQVRYGFFKCVSCTYACRVTAFIDECVSVLLNPDIVFAYGYADFKTSVFIGLDYFAFGCAYILIYKNAAALYGISCILVVHDTACGEATDIFETYIVMCECVAAYITCMVAWAELVYAHYGAHNVCRTVTAERYSADYVVAVLIGKAIE